MTLKSRIASGQDASINLTRHVGTLGYEGLPDELVELTKQCILDTPGRRDRCQRSGSGRAHRCRVRAGSRRASPKARSSVSAAGRLPLGRLSLTAPSVTCSITMT